MVSITNTKNGLNIASIGSVKLETNDQYGVFPQIKADGVGEDHIYIYLGSNVTLWCDVKYAQALCGCLAQINDMICMMKLSETKEA